MKHTVHQTRHFWGQRRWGFHLLQIAVFVCLCVSVRVFMGVCMFVRVFSPFIRARACPPSCVLGTYTFRCGVHVSVWCIYDYMYLRIIVFFTLS